MSRHGVSGSTREFRRVARLQRLRDNDADYVNPLDMLAELREDNRALLASIRKVHDLWSDENDVATTSLLEGKRAGKTQEATTPREGSKTAQVVAMLQRKKGLPWPR
jgi:DNA-binding ferritin-like protein